MVGSLCCTVVCARSGRIHSIVYFQKICIPPPHGGQRNFRGDGGGGGGGQKETISEGVFRVRLISKPSFILLLIGVSKQKLSLSSMIFYSRSAECFFHGLHDSFCNTIVVDS